MLDPARKGSTDLECMAGVIKYVRVPYAYVRVFLAALMAASARGQVWVSMHAFFLCFTCMSLEGHAGLKRKIPPPACAGGQPALQPGRQHVPPHERGPPEHDEEGRGAGQRGARPCDRRARAHRLPAGQRELPARLFRLKTPCMRAIASAPQAVPSLLPEQC